MHSLKGISRRGFLGAMKATAAAATVNPTIVVQQTLPEIAKASTILLPNSYTFDGMRWVLHDALEHGYFDPFSQSSFEEALKNIKHDSPYEYTDIVGDLVFCSDIADALNDDELTKFFIDCEDSHVSKLLKDCLTPNDIRDVFRDLKDKNIRLFTASLKNDPNPFSIYPQSVPEYQAPQWIYQIIKNMSVENQVRLKNYVMPYPITGEYDVPIIKSLKSGIVNRIFEKLKETHVLAGRRTQVLDFILCGSNDLIETTPEFAEAYLVDKPYKLRELKYICDANNTISYIKDWIEKHTKDCPADGKRQYIRIRESACAKIIEFYGADPDELIYPKDKIFITISKSKRPFLGKKDIYDFSLIIDGVKLNDESAITDNFTENLHDLRSTIFDVMGDNIFHEDVYISEVTSHTKSIRVTVPANTEISEFMDMWMAEQNPYDEFWDQEVPNELLFDVDGYIKRHSSPAPQLTRAGLFGRKPELP